MAKCPTCGSVMDKLSTLNTNNTNVGKAGSAPKAPYKGAGNKLKAGASARPNPTNGKTWRTSGRKIMD